MRRTRIGTIHGIHEVKGRCWIGKFLDDELGFCAPEHLSAPNAPLGANQKACLSGDVRWAPSDFYRVEFTLRLVLNKRGKPIVKRNPRAGKR